MLRQTNRVMENLNRLREMVVAQQEAVNEQRARLARGIHPQDEDDNMSEGYQTGGFANSEAKKRRGVRALFKNQFHGYF